MNSKIALQRDISDEGFTAFGNEVQLLVSGAFATMCIIDFQISKQLKNHSECLLRPKSVYFYATEWSIFVSSLLI